MKEKSDAAKQALFELCNFYIDYVFNVDIPVQNIVCLLRTAPESLSLWKVINGLPNAPIHPIFLANMR